MKLKELWSVYSMESSDDYPIVVCGENRYQKVNEGEAKVAQLAEHEVKYFYIESESSGGYPFSTLIVEVE